MGIEQIASEALRLNLHDRVMLAETIWESIEDPYTVVSNMSDDEAIVLVKLRDEEIESGKVKPLSHTQLMSRLRIPPGLCQAELDGRHYQAGAW